MRLMVANYRYFLSGGPERYMFSLMDRLSALGHECIPFSVTYDRNLPTAWARYFVPPLGETDCVYFHEHKKNLKALPRSLSRLFHSPEVERAVRRLVADSAPDAALVLHYLRKLSPSLLTGLKKTGLPVVVRLSDFAMLCPQAHCMRDGAYCHACHDGSLWPSIRHRCVHGSTAASLLNAMATVFHRARGYFDLVDRFVTPTAFMRRAMLEAGYAPQRVIHIPTFVDPNRFRPKPEGPEPGLVAYVGRLERIKGPHILIEAFGLLAARGRRNLRLELAGDGPRDYVRALRHRVEALGLTGMVSFRGQMPENAVSELLGRAMLSVAPSLWPENMPNAVLESLACGTPVVASDLGSLPELIAPDETGALFPPGDPEALAETLDDLTSDPTRVSKLRDKCRATARMDHAPDVHIRSLLQLLESPN